MDHSVLAEVSERGRSPPVKRKIIEFSPQEGVPALFFAAKASIYQRMTSQVTGLRTMVRAGWVTDFEEINDCIIEKKIYVEQAMMTKATVCGRSRRGFTVVEILVGITIIGILAVLIFPVGNRVLTQVAATKSLNQLRSVGVGILLYANDNSDSLPGPLFTSIQPRFRQSDTNQLATNIAPYLGYTVTNSWQAMPEMLFSSWGGRTKSYRPEVGGLSTLMCNWNDYDRATIPGRPFGYPGSDPWSSSPLRLNYIPEPGRLWLVCEQAVNENGVPTFLTKPNSKMFLFANGRVSLEPSSFVAYP